MVIKQQKLVSLEDPKMNFRAIYEDTVIISKINFIYARVHSFIRFSVGFITPKILSAIEQE